MGKTISFDKKSVKEYLDSCIVFWRKKRDNAENPEDRNMAVHYIDAFQSVRNSIFDELLPV